LKASGRSGQPTPSPKTLRTSTRPRTESGEKALSPQSRCDMDCSECLNRLWPEDPRVPQYDPHARRYLPPICHCCPNEFNKDHLDGRVNDLEAISAQRGSIPRQYQEQIQQLRGEVAYLHKKIAEQPVKTKRLPVKSSYKGLEVG